MERRSMTTGNHSMNLLPSIQQQHLLNSIYQIFVRTRILLLHQQVVKRFRIFYRRFFVLKLQAVSDLND